MSPTAIKALTFDTGGTLLDWHTGFRDAFAQAGRRHAIDRDWGQIANRFRRLSLEMMLDLGAEGPPEHNFDEAHALSLGILLREEGLGAFDDTDRHRIAWDAVLSCEGLGVYKLLPQAYRSAA